MAPREVLFEELAGRGDPKTPSADHRTVDSDRRAYSFPGRLGGYPRFIQARLEHKGIHDWKTE